MADVGPLSDSLMRTLALDIVRATEQAAIAAAAWRGRGDEASADRAAAVAMRAVLDTIPVRGRLVNAAGDADDEPLGEGRPVGAGEGPEVDIAVDAIEGKTLVAKDQPGAMSIVAVGDRGAFRQVESRYMDKVAVRAPLLAGGPIATAPPADLVRRVAEARGVPPVAVTVCVLDRPRHARLIEDIRSTGASVRLIGDGDIAAAVSTAFGGDDAPDLYLGVGGAREGVLAAAALRALGGELHGRTVGSVATERGPLATGVVLRETDLVSGSVVFAATGITDGSLLRGVRHPSGAAVTETLLLRSESATRRIITAWHERQG